MLQPALLFTDHMVLQHGKPVAIWGKAAPGSVIRAEIQGTAAETTADAGGKWTVTIGPLTVSFGEELRLTETDDHGQVLDAAAFTDVLVGDVWLAGGQSNMEFYMYYDRELEEEKKVCENPAIRLFDYPEVSYVGQLEEADYLQNYGFWRRCNADELKRYSAVAYYFAKDIQAAEQIPVGILSVNWGGTKACCWLPKEVIAANGGQFWLDEYEDGLKALDLDAYKQEFRANPRNYRVEQIGVDPISDKMLFGMSAEEFQEMILGMLRAAGIDPEKMGEGGVDTSKFMPAIGPKHEWRPSGVYESMLLPVVPYGIRGFLWYQGCSDSDTEQQAMGYRTLFPALIAHWRELWQDDSLPFLFVQLPGFGHWMNSVGENGYVLTRETQQIVSDTVPGTGMAVITDAGMETDIHPKYKRPVGHRLALQALRRVYGHEDVLCEAPTLVSADLSEGRLVLRFENTGEGLTLSDQLPHGDDVSKDELAGLQIFQNGELLPADALKAEASGDTCIVSGSGILAGVPTRVAIARTPWFLVNLYNSAGIPARPAEIEL